MDETPQGFLDYEGLLQFHNGLKSKFVQSTRIDEELSAASWDSQTLTQTVTLINNNVSASDLVVAAPGSQSLYDWVQYGIQYIGNDGSELMFAAKTIPLVDIDIIIRIIGTK